MSLFTTVYEPNRAEFTLLYFICFLILNQAETHRLAGAVKEARILELWALAEVQKQVLWFTKFHHFRPPPFVISKDDTKIKYICDEIKKWIDWVVCISHVLNHYDHHLQILTDFLYFMSDKESKGGKSHMVISYTSTKYEKFTLIRLKDNVSIQMCIWE